MPCAIHPEAAQPLKHKVKVYFSQHVKLITNELKRDTQNLKNYYKFQKTQNLMLLDITEAYVM